MKKPELLAPAGSIESLYAAINSGCDAVYLGGKQFNARQGANNFSQEELKVASDYCHLRGVKIAITINTVYKQKEISGLLEFINKIYQIGIDEVIVQDIGALFLIKKFFPDLKACASTQMTAHSLDDVLYLNKLGFDRIVLSRELSLDEIKYIASKSDVEIECFIHGALCVCYSGQCLMSSMLGGRSGNRGRCAQPCRLKYSLVDNDDNLKLKGHLLSPKDISTIKILPQLIESNITSFKIEGRMKRAEYVAGVVSIYRKYIDLYFENPHSYKVDTKDIKILEQLFNRGGFTNGYFESYSGKDMMSIEKPKNWGVYLGKVESVDKGRCIIKTVEPLNPGDGIEIWTDKEPHVGTNISKSSQRGEKMAVYIKDGEIKKGNLVYKSYDKELMDTLAKSYEKNIRYMAIHGEFSAKVGEPMYIKIYNDSGLFIENKGNIVDSAKNQPITVDKINEQLSKTGNTPFKFVSLELDIDNNIYIPISQLNEFRRESIQLFENKLLKQYHKFSSKRIQLDKQNYPTSRGDKRISALVQNYEQLNTLFESDSIVRIYFEIKNDILSNLDSIIDRCKDEGIELFAALPRIQRNEAKNYFDILKNKNIDGYLVRTWGQLYELKDSDKDIALDYTFNIFNSYTVQYWNEKGINNLTLSPELNYDELNSIGTKDSETLGYGYLPLMTTVQCPIGNYLGQKETKMFCKYKNSSDMYSLKDRLGMNFNIMTDCDRCISYILNSQPIMLLESMDEIIKLPTGIIRLQFTNETSEYVKKIVYSYDKRIKDYKFKDSTIDNLINEFKHKGYTKGHYFRGVE